MKQLPGILNYETAIYSCDIESLYTLINKNVGLEAISYWLNNKSNLISNHCAQNFILEALEFIWRNNNFKFGEIYYNQAESTAMGSKCAPIFACWAIGYKEETKLFLIQLPTFFSSEEIEIIKEVSTQYIKFSDLFQ